MSIDSCMKDKIFLKQGNLYYKVLLLITYIVLCIYNLSLIYLTCALYIFI